MLVLYIDLNFGVTSIGTRCILFSPLSYFSHTTWGCEQHQLQRRRRLLFRYCCWRCRRHALDAISTLIIKSYNTNVIKNMWLSRMHSWLSRKPIYFAAGGVAVRPTFLCINVSAYWLLLLQIARSLVCIPVALDGRTKETCNLRLLLSSMQCHRLQTTLRRVFKGKTWILQCTKNYRPKSAWSETGSHKGLSRKCPMKNLWNYSRNFCFFLA